MPPLKNQRHERFCQELAKGKTADEAYVIAGYVPNRGNASTLKSRQNITNRTTELFGNRHSKIDLSRNYVLEALLENVEKALGRRTVKIGHNGTAKEMFVYRGDVANRAIQLAGIELGMFTERREIKHLGDFEKFTDAELVQILETEARLLLEDQSGADTEEDGNE